MVKIYYQTQFENVHLSDFTSWDRNSLISKITNQDPSGFGISYCGELVDDSIKNTLTENDCVRIVPLKKSQELSDADKERSNEIVRKINKLTVQGPMFFSEYHNEAVATDFVKKFVDMYPTVRNDPTALGVLTDFHVFYAYCALKKSDEKRKQWLQEHPYFLVVWEKVMDHILEKIKSEGYRRGYPQFNRQMQQAQQQQPSQPSITSFDLQSALAQALGTQAPAAAAPSSSSSSGQPSSSSSSQQQIIDQPMPDYSQQLAQLNEFGFADEGLCLLALQQASGDVQLALELIVDMMQ